MCPMKMKMTFTSDDSTATPHPSTLYATLQDQLASLAARFVALEDKAQGLFHARFGMLEQIQRLEDSIKRLTLESQTGDAKIAALERRVYGDVNDPPLGLYRCAMCGLRFESQKHKREHYAAGCEAEKVVEATPATNGAYCVVEAAEPGPVVSPWTGRVIYSYSDLPAAPSKRPGWFARANSGAKWLAFHGSAMLVGATIGTGLYHGIKTALVVLLR